MPTNLMNSIWLRRSLALLAAAAALLTACSDDPQSLVTSAKAYLAKGEARSAVIELKTALQMVPDSPEARYLLGKALLANEEPVGAGVELRKALDLGYPRDTVLPDLARAMLEQGKYKEIVTEFASVNLNDKAAEANLKVTVGTAHSRTGAGAEAMSAFKLALAAVPGHVPALTGIARQLAVNGDAEAAVKAAEEIIAGGKADADAWVLQGDLLEYAKRDKDGAVAAYKQAIAMDKGDLAAHSRLIELLVRTGDTKGAATQVAELVKIRPRHPTTRYYQAQVAYLRGDFKVAKDIVQQLLKGAPNYPPLNQLAGAIELAAGSTEAARAHLMKALHAAPTSIVTRRLLATAHLKSGEADKALELLQPLVGGNSPDSLALALAGEAHLQAGELDKASAMFAAAAKVDPKNAKSLTALARTKFLKGDPEGAVADLQQIAAGDSGAVADLELVNAQLRRGDLPGALKAIDGLERKEPTKPRAAYLRGITYLRLKDGAQARTSFEKALSLEPTYFPAAFKLAEMDIADKKPQLAQQRYEAILKAQPSHLRAQLALAQVRARNGASGQEVAELLGTAVRLNPSEPSARLSLINYHLSTKQPQLALVAAQQADAALPGQLAILDALGRAQHAAGEPNQALATFKKMITLQPSNPLPHVRIAEMNVAAKDNLGAIDSLKRAAAANPDAIAPLQRLFALELHAGRHEDAMKLARDVQKRQPKHSLGFIFEGDVRNAQQNQAAALSAYKTALGKAVPGMAAPRYHNLLLTMGRKDEAEQFAKTWVKDQPADLLFAVYLGDASLARKDYVSAEAAYRLVVARQPTHVTSLNNIAWLMLKTNQPGALAYAEKANELRPNRPELMDTLALALAAEKRIDEALALQKKAVALAPESTTLRLTLARLHLQAGQKPQARALLESLDKLGDKLPEQAEVKGLLASL